MNKKSSIYIIIGIIALVAGIFGILYLITGITITADPTGAKITISGTQISSGQKTRFNPGNYLVKVELLDHVPYINHVNIGLGSSPNINVTLRKSSVLEQVIPDRARFATLSTDRIGMYILSNGAKSMFEIPDISAEQVSTEKISPDFFSNVTNIIWSPNRSLAIIKQDQKTSLYDFKRYDLLHQEVTPFEDGIKYIVWSPDSEEIIYYYAPEDGERTLVRATKSNTDMKRIYNFKDSTIVNPQLDWSPDSKHVLLVSNNELYILDLYFSEMRQIQLDQKVLEAKFTPAGDIIYLSEQGNHIVDINGTNQVDLGIRTNLNRTHWLDVNRFVLAQKSSDELYRFYIYNTLDHEKDELFFHTKIPINPINLIISPDQNKLYFESNGYLYRVQVDTGTY